MKYVRVDEIEQDLHAYLQLVRAGETLVITEENEPIAEVAPIAQAARLPRPYGLCQGEFVVPEDWDAPLPDDVLHLFEG